MVDLIRLTEKRPDAAIAATLKATIMQAEAAFAPLKFEFEFPKTGLGIKRLAPKDISVTNQVSGLQGSVASSNLWGVVSLITTSVWTDWIDIPIDDRIFIVITGLFYRSSTPRINAIRPAANGEDLPIISIEEMFVWDVQRAYFSKPFVISPGNRFKMRIFPEVITNLPERIGLLGFVIGKRSYLISE